MKFVQVSRVAGRLGLTLGGEAMQSGLHFALNIVLIHLLPARDYGVFAITMVIGGMGLTYTRSLTAMPACIYIGRSRSKEAARFYEGTFGAAAIVVSGLIALIAVVPLGASAPTSALAGAGFVGLWCGRSHLRTVHFAFGRYRIATLGDLAFAISGGLLAALAVWRGGNPVTGVFLALAAGNLLGSATMQLLAGEPVRARFDRRARSFYLRLLRRLSWSVSSVTTANLQSQGISLLVVGLTGPAAYAPIAAMLVVFAPLRIAGTALANLIQPEMSKLAANCDVEEIRSLSRRCMLILGIAGLVYGATAMALLPLMKSPSLAGEPIYFIGIFAWLIYLLSLLSVAPRTILEVLMKFRSMASITAAGAVAGMGVIAIVLQFAPASWALAGASLGEAIVLVAAWVAAMRGLRSLAARKPTRATLKQATKPPTDQDQGALMSLMMKSS
jgi:O-antigen/teichoic acid export membrane protein